MAANIGGVEFESRRLRIRYRCTVPATVSYATKAADETTIVPDREIWSRARHRRHAAAG